MIVYYTYTKITYAKISNMCRFGFYDFVIILLTGSFGEAYRILGVFPFNGPSHFSMFSRLMEELAVRGHQVDVIGHHPLKTPLPNYNDIVNLAGVLPSLINNMSYEFGTNLLSHSHVAVALATEFGIDSCDLMGVPQFKKFIDNPPKDPPYDLLIVEIFGANCYFALGQHFKIPMVAVSTSQIWPWGSEIMANPENPAYIPHVFSGLTSQMNFWQRMRNFLTLWRVKLQFSYYSAYQNEQIKKYLGPNAPSLRDAERNVSLILVNSHYSLQGVRPFTTAVVEVGGLHVVENSTQLPEKLQKWLDDSTNGFVYISFGSMLKLETFPKKMLAAIYSSTKKLAPIRFLIKIANAKALPAGLPSNVLTHPWVPQMAVLQHKNIRAFVTHGGLMGTQEAIHCGVPMIGIPVFGDQAQNINLYVRKNVAVLLYHHELNEETLDASLNAVLHDPFYTKSMKKLSSEFRDRPMSAIDTAIFWVEYVIRNGGTTVRSPAMDLEWWQIALLDIYGTLLLAAAIILYLFKVLIYKIVSLVSGRHVGRTLKTKKND